MDDSYQQCDQVTRDEANHLALQHASQVDPIWTDVLSAADAVGLEERMLLHAGPPFKDSRSPSMPILASAVMLCLYEGWADSEESAEELIFSGQVTLRPAQVYGVVTPLAAVISPSTSLVEVVDRKTNSKAWSLLSSGTGPQIRFGTRDPALLERLAFRDDTLAPLLKKQLHKAPVPLIPLAILGVMGGDDLHYQTTVSTKALQHFFTDHAASKEIVELLQTAPLFFLTLWMASCRLILNAMSIDASAQNSSLVVSLAANGESVGISLSRLPEKWYCAPAPIPRGPAIEGGGEGEEQSLQTVSGAIGDSGVIDVAGFGAQLWHDLPEIHDVMKSWYEANNGSTRQAMTGNLKSFLSRKVYTGLDVSRLHHAEDCPALAIAMLDRKGQKGLIGKGITNLPFGLFKQIDDL